MSNINSGMFETALKNARNISEDYYNDEKLREEWSDRPEEFNTFLEQVRDLMQANGTIKQIVDVDPLIQKKVEADHLAGKIGAVDGTDAIAQTELTSRMVYAVAVISATSQTLHQPTISETASHHTIPPINGIGNNLLSFIEKADQYGQDSSWTRTFREHCEREEALRILDHEDCNLALVDGPLYTQNLLTQPVARAGILKAMLDRPQALIGFIKEIRSAKLIHFAGMALRRGEYWVITEWRQLLAHRFKKEKENQSGIQKWLLKHTAPKHQWVRCVYRKNDKAFAFECHPDLVNTGIAIINSPISCSDAINHELPFLLESIDRIVIAQTSARAKSKNLISDSPNYPNLASEREFR